MIMSRSEALRELHGRYGLTQAQAIRSLAIADQHGKNSEGCGTRSVHITAKRNGKEQYELEDGVQLTRSDNPGYTRSSSQRPGPQASTRKGTAMPRGRAASAPANTPTAEDNGARDLSVYLTKDLTPTMVDYVEWLADTFGKLEKLDADRLAFISVTVYPEFQKSDFNRDRKAQRREARAAAPAPADETPAPATTGRRGPGRPPKGTTGGTTGRRGAPAPATAARRGRGRPAAAGAEAPY